MKAMMKTIIISQYENCIPPRDTRIEGMTEFSIEKILLDIQTLEWADPADNVCLQAKGK